MNGSPPNGTMGDGAKAADAFSFSGLVADVVRLARPKDWLKNVFVVMPVPFALAGGHTLDPVAFGLGLIAMSMASSAVYVFNDRCDAERDRLHPGKRNRPVAAGRVSRRAAGGLSAGLALGGLAFAVSSARPLAGVVVTSYLGMQLLYSLHGKHVPLVDVFLLSSGFVLRVLLGCALIEASPSSWLLLCSSALALFLALAKRRSDIISGIDATQRPSLAGYSRGFLDQGLTVSAGLTIMAYALYCMDATALIAGREFLSVPFVVFGVLEYLRLIQTRGAGGSPVDVLLSSPALIVCGVAWIAATLLSVQVPD